MRTEQLWDSRRVRAIVARGDTGALIRLGRQEQGWRQTDLAARIGCSASTVSRLEQRGRRADLSLLRHAADEVGLPTGVLIASLGLTVSPATTVTPHWPRRAEEDPMRRRTLLAAASLAAPASLLAGLDDALASTPAPTGLPTPLATRLAAARRHFDSGRYLDLLALLPGLLGDAHHAARSHEVLPLARLSATYSLTTQALTKIGRYAPSRLTADRANLYAQWSGSPLTAAAAARVLSVVLRHQNQHEAAQRHITEATNALEHTGLATPAQAAAYAQVLCTTSYTAARAGDRTQALATIQEAARAAQNLPHEAPADRLFSLTPAAVDLYAVSVHWALGDAGAALEAGRHLHEAQFSTAERKGRMHTDLARAWWQWGKPEQTAAALLCAARVSPAEVRDRPAIRSIVTDLHTSHPRVTGVRELTAAAGISA